MKQLERVDARDKGLLNSITFVHNSRFKIPNSQLTKDKLHASSNKNLYSRW